MTKTVEEILGVKFGGERTVPGMDPVSGREYWYIEDDGNDDFDALFVQIVGAEPVIPTSGGALTGGCELTLPDGRKFHALSYKGDLEGWRKQIHNGARKLGVAAAQLVDKELVFSDASVVPVSDCKARFY